MSVLVSLFLKVPFISSGWYFVQLSSSICIACPYHCSLSIVHHLDQACVLISFVICSLYMPTLLQIQLSMFASFLSGHCMSSVSLPFNLYFIYKHHTICFLLLREKLFSTARAINPWTFSTPFLLWLLSEHPLTFAISVTFVAKVIYYFQWAFQAL